MTEPENREADLYTFNEPLSVNEDQNAADPPEMKGSDGSLSDHELLFAYVQGDEKAFETLVGKYFRMVYAVAARQTGDPHLAEEIAQSVFLILCRKARGFSSKSS